MIINTNILITKITLRVNKLTNVISIDTMSFHISIPSIILCLSGPINVISIDKAAINVINIANIDIIEVLIIPMM